MSADGRNGAARREVITRFGGLTVTIAYAVLVAWLFSNQPQTVSQITGGLAATIGGYTVNEQAFADGLRFFRNDQFVEARMAFGRADPALRDARTQFYVAYSYYRQGWGRLYHDTRSMRKDLRRSNGRWHWRQMGDCRLTMGTCGSIPWRSSKPNWRRDVGATPRT